MKISEYYIDHIEKSLSSAIRETSAVSQDVLNIVGMSGACTRHFLNNLGAMSDVRYLEIGTSTGSTLSSMLCDNKITALAIDNWSREYPNIEGWCQSDTPKDEFIRNLNMNRGSSDVEFIEGDCWDVTIPASDTFNVYMYDANHSEESHYKALNYYDKFLDNVFIYLIDDWNWKNVQSGTLKGISDNNLNILYQKEIFTMDGDEHPPWNSPPYAGRKSKWHNGISIFVLEKSLV